MYKPNEKEAALLLLYALSERGDRRGKPLTRARVSRLTLKQLWNCEQLTQPWLDQVNEWLLSAGWTLVHAGTTFGVVKKEVVENWPRVASKHMTEEINQVKLNNYKFSKIEHLLGSKPTDSRQIPKKRARSPGG